MAFHLSTKGAGGIIVGRAVQARESAVERPPRRRRCRPPSGGGALLAATLIALLVKAFLVDLAVVEGRSMEPSFPRGSLVLVLRCAYGLRSPGADGVYWVRWGTPRPGDSVLAFPPASGRRVVKRVADFGPDANTGEAKGGRREQEYFLAGDNPGESRDSREYGPVGIDDVAGKVLRLRL